MKSSRDARWRRWAVLAALAAVLFLVGCSNDGSGGGDDDHTQQPGDDDESPSGTLDDCGYKIVDPPAGCDKCHGMPPKTARHPENARCYRCHGYVVDQDFNWVKPALHQNGAVDVAVGCTSCHGWNNGVAPPQNLKGECGADKSGVGSHVAMRDSPIPAHQVACSNCHVVPTEIWQSGHVDGDGKVEVTFKQLATMHGAKPVWDGKKCSGVYCHGATLKGGAYKEPIWGDDSGKASMCGACHRLTDPSGNTDANCHGCHPTSVNADRSIIEAGTHLNGAIDLPGDAAKKGGRQ